MSSKWVWMLVTLAWVNEWCHCCLEKERIGLLEIKAWINHPNGSSLTHWVENCWENYGQLTGSIQRNTIHNSQVPILFPSLCNKKQNQTMNKYNATITQINTKIFTWKTRCGKNHGTIVYLKNFHYQQITKGYKYVYHKKQSTLVIQQD